MTIHSPSRRAFLAGSGLVIGFAMMPAFARGALQGVPAGGASDLVAMNTFVKVGVDNTVTILSKHLEMGQGPLTGLATLVAEELDADWSQMRAVHSPADDKVYANLMFGIQGTGGSPGALERYTSTRYVPSPTVSNLRAGSGFWVRIAPFFRRTSTPLLAALVRAVNVRTADVSLIRPP